MTAPRARSGVQDLMGDQKMCEKCLGSKSWAPPCDFN